MNVNKILAAFADNRRQIAKISREQKADKLTLDITANKETQELDRRLHAQRTKERAASIASLEDDGIRLASQLVLHEAATGETLSLARSDPDSSRRAAEIAQSLGVNAEALSNGSLLRQFRRMGVEPSPAQIKDYLAAIKPDGLQAQVATQTLDMAHLKTLSANELAAELSVDQIETAIPRWTPPAA